MKNKKEYNMKLGDVFGYATDAGKISILRVPGGWIYTIMMDFEGAFSDSVFVPIHKVKKDIIDA